MNRTDVLLAAETRRVQSQMEMALMRIRLASTCTDAVRHCHINVRAPYQALRHLMGVSRFNAQAEPLLKAIVLRQFDEYRSADTINKEWLRDSLIRDWNHLRGHFPRLYSSAIQLLQE
jgi:hypothetical protein